MDAAELRAQFPVLERLAYLNAGTDGPIPRAALAAARDELERAGADGRSSAHFGRRFELMAAQRAGYAALLGCEPADVALTTSASEGIGVALAGLDLRPGDEVLTSDQEHPGLLGPLSVARAQRGVRVRVAPFAQLADAVSPQTRLVACSHVSWVSGELAPAELGVLDGVPLVFDGAQSLGAVAVDVAALGCDVYAAAGQKWLCGPDGAGALYVSPALRERIAPTRASYTTLVDPGAGIDAAVHEDCRRYDNAALSAEACAFAVASLHVLDAFGWPAVHERGPMLAGRLVELLTEQGYRVAPRGDTTLVSWEVDDAESARDRLSEAGVVVRNLPDRPLLRASVGAWNDEADLERLVAGLAGDGLDDPSRR